MYFYSIASGTTYYNNFYNINGGKLWNLFFADSSSKWYYLSTQFIGTAEGGLWQPLATVYNNQIGLAYLFDSDCEVYSRNYHGVRPVVSLGRYLDFGGDAETGWTIE